MTRVETYFGNKEWFAIRYIPGYKNKDHYYAYCHLVLGGQIIGDPNEMCFLNTWKYLLKRIVQQIEDRFEVLWHEEFKEKTDAEIFELIWKANQFPGEFSPSFHYLPALENDVWTNCHFSIDETTDAYLITMTKEENAIKFIWQGWREPCPKDRIGKLFSTVVSKELVLETLKNCISKIESESLNYPVLEQ